MQINLIPDSTVSSAPAGFTAVIKEACSIVEQVFTGNYTLNISYGWGSWDNQIDPGLSGVNGAEGGPVNGTTVSYQTLKTWLTTAGTAPDQQLAYASLPTNTASFPAGANTFYVSSAQEKALGVYTGSQTAVDGAIGFGTTSSPTFWLEAALHEICHAMGRYTDFYAGNPTIMDLFRYSSAGQYSWTGYQSAYLSLDGGKTVAANFSTVSDYADFAVNSLAPNDPFDWMINGSTPTLTGLDVELMNVLGFASAFQPSTISISVVTYAVVAAGQSLSVPSLVTNISNPHGDTIGNYMYLAQGGSGHLTLNGVTQPDSQWIYANAGDSVQYVGGTTSGTDTLEIGVYDSTTNSYAFSSSINAITTGGQHVSTVPAITSLTESPNTGIAQIGQTVTLTVTLSNAVTVTGTPTIALNDGGTAVFSGGSGTNSLTFTYTIAPKDSSVSSLAVSTINLNGSTITDAAGNAASLSISGLIQNGPQIQIPTNTVAEVYDIYQAVLQRAPSTSDVSSWLAAEPYVGDGALIASLINSPEAQQEINSIIRVITLGTGLFPTATQMAGWAGYVQTGGSLESIATAFASSTMFQQIIGNGAEVDPNSPVTPAIMQTIIANALGTPATQHQIQGWVDTGLSVANVFVDFALGEQYTARSFSSVQQYLIGAVDKVIEANGGAGNGGSSTISTTYNDSGYMIDALTNSAAGITNTYNFANSAVLEIGGVSHGHVVVSTTGFNPTLEILATASFTLDTLTYNANLVLDSTGGAIDIGSLTNTTSTQVEMVLSPMTIALNGANPITVGAINDQALTAIDAAGSSGAIDLGTAATPLTQASLTVLGGTGALTVYTAGSQDVIQLGNVATGTTISAPQIIHAAGAGDIITFATTAVDGTQVLWGAGAASIVDGGSIAIGVGANDTINFGDNTAGGSELVVVTGDLTGATTSGGTSTSGINMICLTNVVHAGGDELLFNNVTSEQFNSNAVNVSSASSLARAFDIAAANAAASQSGGKIAGHTGVIDWFQYGGNTYLVEAINTGSTAAGHIALASTDEVVKIVGQVDLHAAVLAFHTVTL